MTKSCVCWIPDDEPCHDIKCYAEGKDGYCYGPNDLVPYYLKPTDLYCGAATYCKCWIPIDNEPCKETKCHAEGKDGYCYGPNEIIPQNLRPTNIFCDTATKCMCWIPIEDGPCDNTKCHAEGKDGRCFGPNEIPPTSLNLIRTDIKCDTEADCICWIPEDGPCGETKCQAEGKDGLCYLPHQSPPQHLNLRQTDIKCNSAIGGPASECVCWIPEDGPCSDTTCQAEGKDGQCFGPNEIPSPDLNLKQTDVKCLTATGGPTTDCICWIPEDDGPCHETKCQAEGKDGQCFGPNQVPLPELNLKQTDIKCDSATDCICWIPKDGSVDCKDNWKTSRCEEEKEKGKCKKNKQIRKKCKKTCDLCPITIGN